MFTLTKSVISLKNIIFSYSLFLHFTETYHEFGYSQGFSSCFMKLDITWCQVMFEKFRIFYFHYDKTRCNNSCHTNLACCSENIEFRSSLRKKIIFLICGGLPKLTSKPYGLWQSFSVSFMSLMSSIMLFMSLILSLMLLIMSSVGEKKELGKNQSLLCRAPTLFTKSVKVWNKWFNWSVCKKFFVLIL